MAAVDTTLVVAAIDFGTTYSGWAFSFRHEYESDPTKVSAKQQWPGGRLVSEKAPTCVLINPDGETLEAFGFEAENKYAELVEDRSHGPFYYFHRFKMMLFDKKTLTRHDTLEDISGKTLQAKTVFALAIRFLKNDLLDTLQYRHSGNPLRPCDIKWVLTVPAIWTDPAKQFMREAATEAGIKCDNLLIVLEPEAAAIFCKHLPIEQMSSGDEYSLSVFSPGQKYLIVDAGGGTVDITVHEVTEKEVLREIHQASGGAWGGTKVDEAFKKFLEEIFTEEVMNIFKTNCLEEYLDLMQDFEIKKRDTDPTKERKMTIRIPLNLSELIKSKGIDYSVRSLIAKAGFSDTVAYIPESSKLRIDSSVVKGFFAKAVNSVVNHLEELLKEPKVERISAIVMVGGFSDSRMLTSQLKSAFNRKIIIPKDACLVVLKGAVLSGHCPSMIAERVCRYTYGIATNKDFNPNIHPEEDKVIYDGVEKCNTIFSAFVHVGQTVVAGKEETEKEFSTPIANQTSMDIHIYASTCRCPLLVTEASCFKLGSMEVGMPDTTGGKSRKVRVKMFFSGPEIEVEVVDVTSGNTERVTVDFLG